MIVQFFKPLKPVVLGVAAASVTAFTGNAGSNFNENAAVTLPQEIREFVNINPAIKMASAYGDRSVGAHGTFGQFPANFETPEHTHSGAYHGVVIKGTMTNPFDGDKNPPKMEPGSYWYVPANARHSTACISDTPCEFYFHADSSFDFHVVE
jgi:mannose-6-phosphate isomerase-like protein (cupin superfamily)